MYLIRLIKIITVGIHYGLEEFLEHERFSGLRAAIAAVFFWRVLKEPRAVRLRLALEALGPIFVKFGQVLSTRRDLLPADIADELAKLQDQVPPFRPELARAPTLERAYGKPVARSFSNSTRSRSRARRSRRCISRALPDGTRGRGQGAAARHRDA